jgi:signal transduction histidine kinase
VLATLAMLLVVLTGTALTAVGKTVEDLRRVARTHELIAQVRRARIALGEVEVAARDHLLTGDRARLAGSERARQAIHRHLARAREVADDDPDERVRVEALTARVEERLRSLDATAAARGTGTLDPAAAAAAVEKGARQDDRIHDVADEVLDRAEARLSRDASEADEAAVARNVGVAGVLCLTLALLAGGFFFVRRELRRRLAAEAGLREATRVAEASSRELEAFSYTLAHDLRAPLRAIDGFAQALVEDAEPRLEAPERDFLRRIRAAAQRMGTLIDDLLDLARITRTRFVRESVDLSATAAAVVEELRSADPGRDVEVVVQPGLTAEGDRRLLRVALENLLGNAWKYTSKKPRARIEFARVATAPPTYVVRDDGAGFDMAYAGRLFAPFQRLHGEAEFPGTGIGLAGVQRIVHRHGGTVRAEGKVGEGASFYFTLPVGAAPPTSAGAS